MINDGTRVHFDATKKKNDKDIGRNSILPKTKTIKLRMSSAMMTAATAAATTNNDAFQSFIEESEDDDGRSGSSRPSLVPRQISFAQQRATLGEIVLVLLPYVVLLIDVFVFFLFRGFKLTSFDSAFLTSQQ